jgi:hypothetical protein
MSADEPTSVTKIMAVASSALTILLRTRHCRTIRSIIIKLTIRILLGARNNSETSLPGYASERDNTGMGQWLDWQGN